MTRRFDPAAFGVDPKLIPAGHVLVPSLDAAKAGREANLVRADDPRAIAAYGDPRREAEALARRKLWNEIATAHGMASADYSADPWPLIRLCREHGVEQVIAAIVAMKLFWTSNDSAISRSWVSRA
jgi:hypothetical protein